MLLHRTVVAVTLAAGLISASAETASAVTASSFTYTAPKTGTFAVSHLAFHPMDANSDNSYVGALAVFGLAGSGCFRADLRLPNGAKLQKVRFNYKKHAFFAVRWLNFESGDYTFSLYADRNDASGNRVGYTITPGAAPTVDNASSARDLVVCLQGGGDAFFGAVVTYTYTDAGS